MSEQPADKTDQERIEDELCEVRDAVAGEDPDKEWERGFYGGIQEALYIIRDVLEETPEVCPACGREYVSRITPRSAHITVVPVESCSAPEDDRARSYVHQWTPDRDIEDVHLTASAYEVRTDE